MPLDVDPENTPRSVLLRQFDSGGAQAATDVQDVPPADVHFAQHRGNFFRAAR